MGARHVRRSIFAAFPPVFPYNIYGHYDLSVCGHRYQFLATDDFPDRFSVVYQATCAHAHLMIPPLSSLCLFWIPFWVGGTDRLMLKTRALPCALTMS